MQDRSPRLSPPRRRPGLGRSLTNSVPLSLLCLALAGPAATGATTEEVTKGRPAGPTETLRIEPHVFEAADGRKVDAELGRFRVPENRRAATGKTIELAFVRFPTTSKQPGPPIVYLAGGPGGPGSGTAEGSRFDLFQALREQGDVIAFDQRGTGLSERLPRCSQGWSLPLDQEGTRKAFEAAVEQAARLCAAEWRGKGVDLDAYNTEESADDLEDLRRALGVPKLNLWSISYGTHLAMSALRRHPDSFAAAVLAGPEGPDQTYKLPRDGQDLLEAVAHQLGQDPGAETGFLADVRATLERLKKGPVEVEVAGGETLRIGFFDIQMLAAGGLRGPETLFIMPPAFRAMAQGDFSSVVPFLLRRRGGRLGAMSDAMDSASGITAARRATIAEQSKNTLLADAINFPLAPTARGLGVRDLGDAFRGPLETDVPILMITGTMDGRTPVANARELLPGFSKASHLILEGAGHSDPLFLSSPKILDRMRSLFQGEALAKEERIDVTGGKGKG